MFNHSYSNQFGRATLNNIQGNQHINYYLQHQHQSVPAHVGGEEWKTRMYREYSYVPAGNIKIIKTVAVQGVLLREYENDPDCLKSHQRYDASRANREAHLACLVEGRKESSPFLCVAYTGSDAQKVFKRDYLAFSRIRNAHVMQLRGFNDSDIPMVLFHEELIPVHHIFQRHRELSIALQCYIALQASIARESILEWHQTEVDHYYCDNVWIQPRNGRISFGPRVPLTEYFSVYGGWELGNCTDMPALPTYMYNANCLLKHLLNYSSDNFLLSGLDSTLISHLLYREKVYIPQNNQVWLRSSGRPITNFQPRSCWTHRVWQFPFVEDHFELITLEDGRTRLSIKSITPQLLHECIVSFVYGMDEGLPHCRRHGNWLSQSCSIFSTMNIPRHEWSDCTLLGQIWLDLIIDDTELDCIASDMIPHDLETQYYLFVLPPPQNINNSPDVITWMLGKDLYYWSSDPNGQTVMPESQRVSLGLPSPIPEAWGTYETWSAETYDLMRAWQEAKGFDPSTTDFARSLGHTILEPLFSDPMDGDVERFRALSEDTDGPSYTTLKAHNGDEGAMDVDLPTSLSSLRIEVGGHGTSVVEGFVAANTDVEVD
ncbi:hypothetical protein E1B28_012038 [Marasmius oreades]|uniref:Uncharacterized protein n=1 Tax=Marasmius oreades TaxID=181124 RepID=A0A9P7RQS0_9AGAR|nr:uncharacterized protein E1B28_012038 [Marasmius oreades]KAG7087999.1 hypothetical protein E1B28_012038 [Marasmius oreades]